MMKKLLTLCFFAITMMFSVQGLNAQNTTEINAAASLKAKELRKTIKFDNAQLEEVYQAYRQYEKTYQRISDNLEANSLRLEKIEQTLDTKFKTILNEEQFTRYLELYREN